MGSRGSGESTGLSACMEARMVASGYLLAAGGGRVQKAQKGEGHAQEGQRSEGAGKEGDSDMLGLWRKHECMRVRSCFIVAVSSPAILLPPFFSRHPESDREFE